MEKGEQRLFDDVRYFFYITNDWVSEADEIVFSANDRCHQENLLAQLQAARALQAPVDNLDSNWAYMVMTALAWNLKAWWALMLPERAGRWQERHREEKQWVLGLEFKTFVNAFIRLPCQIIRTGRKLVCIACCPGIPTSESFSGWSWPYAADGDFLKSESGCSDPPRPQTQPCRNLVTMKGP